MINIIACIGKNNELGKDNKLLWSLPNDLKFFRETTLNHVVVMGKNTFASIGRKLPKRVNVVISTSMESDEVEVFKTLEEALEKYKDEEIYIIGGATLYKYALNLADNLILTEVPLNADADCFFPEFNKDDYEKNVIRENEDNGIAYEHVVYRRKK